MCLVCKRMSWIQEDNLSTDENAKLCGNIHAFKTFLQLQKENVLCLKAEESTAGLRGACFVQWLIENLDFQDVNIVLWASTDMEHSAESGPWTRTIYHDNEGVTLRAVRELAQHLNIPTENVLFLVPGDEFVKEKVGEFVSNMVYKYKWSNAMALVWLKCLDRCHERELKRMVS